MGSTATWYIRRDMSEGAASWCVKLGGRDRLVDALTAAGVRGIVDENRFMALWRPTTGAPVERRVSVTRAWSNGDTDDAWLVFRRDCVPWVEVWPWHAMDTVLARLDVLGLTLGVQVYRERYGPPECGAIMTTYAVAGTYREPPAFELST